MTGGARTHWKAPPWHGAHVKRPLADCDRGRFNRVGFSRLTVDPVRHPASDLPATRAWSGRQSDAALFLSRRCSQPRRPSRASPRRCSVPAPPRRRAQADRRPRARARGEARGDASQVQRTRLCHREAARRKQRSARLARADGSRRSRWSGIAGPEGKQGPKGDPAARITGWLVHQNTYEIQPLLSDGTRGAVIHMRPLFDAFNEATIAGDDELEADAAAEARLDAEAEAKRAHWAG